MRLFFATVLAGLALAGGTALPAEAFGGASLREAGPRERDAALSYGAPQPARLHLARAVLDEARPASRWRSDGRWERPDYANSRQARSSSKRASKHAGKSRDAARRSANGTRRNAAGIARIPVRPYPVQALPVGSDLTGVASYYWQDARTATGARFNPEGMTAAHLTLPFGTRVRVTHLGNGRSVDVRINDRGPYIAGRIIDLSRGAAGIIGMHQQGVARVKVTVLGR